MNFLLFALLCWFQLSASVVINCPDQSESCACPSHENECEFTFRINKRFSFTSYGFIENSTQLSNSGHLYFINSTGYYPSIAGESCSMRVAQNDADFTANNCSVPMTLDGMTYRPLLLINGRIPGPTLIVTEGQTIIVHVYNNLINTAITIHWHGMFQKGSSWMDGVGFVSQPPIDAGSSFDYIFKAEPSGTHWYHSHVGTQKSDGLFGALIVQERVSLGQILGNSSYDDVINEAGQHTFTLIDWQRNEEFLEQALDSLGFYTQLPIGQVPSERDTVFTDQIGLDETSLGNIPFWSGLINGRGRKDNVSTPLSTFYVQSGGVFHFRMVGSITSYAFRVSIDGHKLKAIASDGSYFEPVEVDYMIIHAGETYDFLLEAERQEGENFWIRAETLVRPPFDHEQAALAILSYGNSSGLDWRNGYSNVPERTRTCTADQPCWALNCPFENYPNSFNISCITFTSLTRKAEQIEETEIPRFPPDQNCADCMHFLNFAFQGENGDSSVNAKSNHLPQTAYATNCFQYEQNYNDNSINTCNNIEVNANSSAGGVRCINVVPIANNHSYSDSYEKPSIAMVFSNIVDHFAHPIHLHGHTYHVVHVGYGKYNETTGKLIGPTDDIDCGNEKLCVNPRWKNGIIPQAVRNRTANGVVVSSAIRKDTLIVPAGGYVVIAFLADNPGYWILHCHIEEHLLDGMAIIVQEYSPDQQWMPPPGINLHGSFNWNAEEYNSTLTEGGFCSLLLPITERSTSVLLFPETEAEPSEPGGSPPPAAPVSPSNRVTVSTSLAISLVIIVVLFILVIVLSIAIIVIYCRGRNSKLVTLSEPALLTNEVEMT